MRVDHSRAARHAVSRGVLDQEALDAARDACAHAAKIGCRAIGTVIHFNDDGTRTFRWRYEPIKKARAANIEEAPKRVGRGARAAAQGGLDLDD